MNQDDVVYCYRFSNANIMWIRAKLQVEGFQTLTAVFANEKMELGVLVVSKYRGH